MDSGQYPIETTFPQLPASQGGTSAAPASATISVEASDTVALPDGLCRGLLVGTAGAATIVDATGTERTGVPLQAGYNPIQVSQVYATGLTAANIWALY